MNNIYKLSALALLAITSLNALDLTAGIDYKNTKECIELVDYLNDHQGEKTPVSDMLFDIYVNQCEITNDLELDEKIQLVG